MCTVSDNIGNHIARVHLALLLICVFLCVFRRQLTALAMLLLDPYYRTIEGFEVLFRLLHFGNAQLTNCFILTILPCLVFMLGSNRKGMDQFWTQIPTGTFRLFLHGGTFKLLAISPFTLLIGTTLEAKWP